MRICPTVFAALLLWLFAGPSPALCAAPFVESIDPPAVTRGAVCRVELRGTAMQQAVGLWTSAPGATLVGTPVGESTPYRAVFDIQVPADAPLGIFGMRLATRGGLSNVHLFLIDELPVMRRRELPDVLNAMIETSLPALIAAPCRRAGIDRYLIEVTAGQRVSFEVIGNRLGKNFDPLVTIRDFQGRQLAQRDNDAGLMFDCRFDYTFAVAGMYVVEVSDARYEGNEHWHSLLRMGDFPAARVAVPSAVQRGRPNVLTLPEMESLRLEHPVPLDASLGTAYHTIRVPGSKTATWIPLLTTDAKNVFEIEPNDMAEDATPICAPAVLGGVLARPGETDWFAFALEKGQSIRVIAAAREFGSAADLEIALVDPNGRQVSRVDDVQLEEASFGPYRAGVQGIYRLMVRDMAQGGGPDYAYRVEVRDGGPWLDLTSEVARVTLPQGTFQPVPLKVKRNGFAGPIELEMVGAPAGLRLEPATIPADADELVCRLHADESAAEGLATLQIVGRAKIEGEEPHTVQARARTQPLVDRQLRDKDRIVIALREDQRRLPPSLTSRIAVMVTPPAPFLFELPDQEVLMPKYQLGKFRIITTRRPGFEAPITFSAKGGQIGNESEERDQIYGRFPVATVERPMVEGVLHNRILTNYQKHRVDLTATAEHEGHQVAIVRTFTLDVRRAFEPSVESELVTIAPGGKARVMLLANRVPTFAGAVTVRPQPQVGFTLPESVEIPAGQPGVEIEIAVDADVSPRRYALRFQATGFVGKYEESVTGKNLTVEVKKPEPPKEKP